MNPSQQVDRLIRKLETLAALSDEEKQALRGLPRTTKAFKADLDIVREGDNPAECCLVLEGMVFRYLMLGDGRRQIMGFYIPGDIPDLQSLHITTMDHSVATLMPTTDPMGVDSGPLSGRVRLRYPLTLETNRCPSSSDPSKPLSALILAQSSSQWNSVAPSGS
jgi:hypothetical protein